MAVKSSNNLGFHESTLSGVRADSPGTIHLLFEGVQIDGRAGSVSVHLDDVSQVLRDGLPIEGFGMEAPDCEVLTFNSTPTSIRLIVEWNDFEHRLHTTRAYEITCGHVRIDLDEPTGSCPASGC